MSRPLDEMFARARAAAGDCDTCWYLCTDEALGKLGDEVIAMRLAVHLDCGHRTDSEGNL